MPPGSFVAFISKRYWRVVRDQWLIPALSMILSPCSVFSLFSSGLFSLPHSMNALHLLCHIRSIPHWYCSLYIMFYRYIPPAQGMLSIYFFSKFSFPCGSIRSLKSAFIIGGLSVLGEQVSPCNTKTRFAAFCITGLTWWGFRAPYPRLAYPSDMQF